MDFARKAKHLCSLFVGLVDVVFTLFVRGGQEIMKGLPVPIMEFVKMTGEIPVMGIVHPVDNMVEEAVDTETHLGNLPPQAQTIHSAGELLQSSLTDEYTESY